MTDPRKDPAKPVMASFFMPCSQEGGPDPPDVSFQRAVMECPIVRFSCSGWRSAFLGFFGEVAGRAVLPLQLTWRIGERSHGRPIRCASRRAAQRRGVFRY